MNPTEKQKLREIQKELMTQGFRTEIVKNLYGVYELWDLRSNIPMLLTITKRGV